MALFVPMSRKARMFILTISSHQHKNNNNDDIIEPIDTNLDDLVSASLTTKNRQFRRHPNSNNGNNLDAETGSLDATPTQMVMLFLNNKTKRKQRCHQLSIGKRF